MPQGHGTGYGTRSQLSVAHSKRTAKEGREVKEAQVTTQGTCSLCYRERLVRRLELEEISTSRRLIQWLCKECIKIIT